MSADDSTSKTDFIRKIIAEDLASGKHDTIVTRFPPEPNGYLHLGHIKSICLNFGIAQENPGARCHLRMDDTNPAKEESRYVQSMIEDIRWLGFDWGENFFFASDYYEQLYQWAEELIEKGLAYVDEQSGEQIRATRGTLTEPGTPSPHRKRPASESLALFRRMKAGEFATGALVLRAKIDMASPNLNLRDPVLYRILHATHHRTGDTWCLYPLYDFAHPLSDAIEHITHSLCTLEFEDHRPLYDWFVEHCSTPARPRQIEFSKLNFTYTLLSKRRLLRLVEEGHVESWDDPRMPTISAVRRRGYPARAFHKLIEKVGVTKFAGTTDLALLEHAVREELNAIAPRAMAVLKPLKVTLTNWPADKVIEVHAPLNPEQPELGQRTIPFSRQLWIEQDDFLEEAPRKFFRLKPGGEVRLRGAYVIRCQEVVKDQSGQVLELKCTADLETLGKSPEGRKVKGVIHWVSTAQATPATVRLYDRLFTAEDPTAGETDFTEHLNPKSLEVLENCLLEPHLAQQAKPGQPWQFERLGYFCLDTQDSHPDALVFNRTLPLRDSWAKEKKKG
ncbi:MAG: glutamine--tRNA ligase/YqeY domain fusion protein [Verrucomicrobiota bacterium]